MTSSASSAGKRGFPEKEPWKGSFNPSGQHRRAKPVPKGAGIHATLWGGAVAISLHALLAAALMLVPQRGLHDRGAVPVEVDVLPARPPETLPPPTDPPPPLPPPDPKPLREVRKHVAAIKPPRPMPNQEVKPAPSTEEPVQPVFGVTQDSVVPGDSPVAVPVGNTLMTKDRTLAKAPPVPLPAAPPPPAFVPVDEESIAEWPMAKSEVKAKYPEIARRMGIGGKVLLRIGIDRKGNLKSVHVLRKVGYGMDEEAVKAMWQFKFDPAKDAEGKPVDVVITYTHTFQPPADR